MLGAATTPTIPEKVLKAVEVSSREMVFASEKYKASISAPAISVTVLASVKSVTLLGLTNQSERSKEATQVTQFPRRNSSKRSLARFEVVTNRDYDHRSPSLVQGRSIPPSHRFCIRCW